MPPVFRQGTLPFNRRSAGQSTAIRENVVEAQTDYHLNADGALVLSTVHRYKLQTCPSCGARFRPTGGYGSTPGVPDRLARFGHWLKGLWLGIELKGSDTRLSPAQKALEGQGAIVIARTGRQASDALREADEFLSRLISPLVTSRV